MEREGRIEVKAKPVEVPRLWVISGAMDQRKITSKKLERAIMELQWATRINVQTTAYYKGY